MIKTRAFWISMIILLVATCTHVYLADTSGGWRPAYDIVMKWVNFGILGFVIVKYLKAPILNFLNGQKDDMAKKIGDLEKEKENFSHEVNKTLDLVNKGEAHIQEIKERISREGERTKDRIIADAQTQSSIMIEETKKKVKNQLLHALETFRAELVDAAIEIASEKLPAVITDDDNLKLLNTFLSKTDIRLR